MGSAGCDEERVWLAVAEGCTDPQGLLGVADGFPRCWDVQEDCTQTENEGQQGSCETAEVAGQPTGVNLVRELEAVLADVAMPQRDHVVQVVRGKLDPAQIRKNQHQLITRETVGFKLTSPCCTSPHGTQMSEPFPSCLRSGPQSARMTHSPCLHAAPSSQYTVYRDARRSLYD